MTLIKSKPETSLHSSVPCISSTTHTLPLTHFPNTISWHIRNTRNATMSTISPLAQTSFTNATAYDAHRPTYPPSTLQHLLTQCRVAGKRGARIIDLAAGTGIFTAALAAREEEFEIVAVEPHAEMRRVLSERGLRGVRVVEGTAEDVPVGDGWADAVFVAQVGD